MISVEKTNNLPKKPTKTIADLKKEIVKMVKDEMRELNKAPLSKPEEAATETIAKIINDNLKGIGII